jgi:hypothetical protein
VTMCAFCGEREAAVHMMSGGELRPECEHCATLPMDSPIEESGLIAADIMAETMVSAMEVN